MHDIYSFILHIYIYVYYKYEYIYIHIIHTYLYTYTHYIYIYIYICFVCSKKRCCFFQWFLIPPRRHYHLQAPPGDGNQARPGGDVCHHGLLFIGSGGLGWPSQDRNGMKILMG